MKKKNGKKGRGGSWQVNKRLKKTSVVEDANCKTKKVSSNRKSGRTDSFGRGWQEWDFRKKRGPKKKRLGGTDKKKGRQEIYSLNTKIRKSQKTRLEEKKG